MTADFDITGGGRDGKLTTRDYHSLFSYLSEAYCLPVENIRFVDNVAAWCEAHGIPEQDAERPMRFIPQGGNGCRLLVEEKIPEEVLNGRMNALSVRNHVKGVAHDEADRLNSDRKKLAYLFLIEYVSTLPEISKDEHLADEWAFREMERLGFFKA